MHITMYKFDTVYVLISWYATNRPLRATVSTWRRFADERRVGTRERGILQFQTILDRSVLVGAWDFHDRREMDHANCLFLTRALCSAFITKTRRLASLDLRGYLA